MQNANVFQLVYKFNLHFLRHNHNKSADQLSLRWSFLRNKGLFKQAAHFYFVFINCTYI